MSKDESFELDEIDKRLISLLEIDASESSEELAKRLSVDTGSVRTRMRRLVQNEVVRVVGIADPEKAGYAVSAVIGLTMNRPPSYEDL